MAHRGHVTGAGLLAHRGHVAGFRPGRRFLRPFVDRLLDLEGALHADAPVGDAELGHRDVVSPAPEGLARFHVGRNDPGGKQVGVQAHHHGGQQSGQAVAQGPPQGLCPGPLADLAGDAPCRGRGQAQHVDRQDDVGGDGPTGRDEVGPLGQVKKLPTRREGEVQHGPPQQEAPGGRRQEGNRLLPQEPGRPLVAAFGRLVGVAERREHRHHERVDREDDERERHVVQEGHSRHPVQARRVDGRPQQQGPGGRLGRSPLGDHPEEEHGHHARGHEAPGLLDVVEHAPASADPSERGGPGTGDDDEQGGHHLAEPHQRLLRGLLLEVPLVEVHGQDGRGGVEHRVQRAHHGPEQRGEHQPANPRRQDLLEHVGIGAVLVGDLLGVELKGHDPGKDDNEGHEQLQRGGQHHALLPFGDALGSQGPLGDELVQAPIEELRNPQAADEHGHPGHLGVAERLDGGELVPGVLEEVGNAVGDLIVPGQIGATALERAQRLESQEGGQDAAGDQSQAVEQVGPDDGLQSAPDRVEPGDDPDQPDGQDHEPVLAQHALHVEVGLRLDVVLDRLAEDCLQTDCPGVQHGRDNHEDVGDHHVQRHQAAGAGAVAVFEILGNRIDAAAQELGQQENAHQHDHHGGRPFVAGHSQPCLVACPRHAHKVLGRDVRRDQRDADQPPGELAARQEVVLRRFLAPRHVHRKADDHDDVCDERARVKDRELEFHRCSPVGRRGLVSGGGTAGRKSPR